MSQTHTRRPSDNPFIDYVWESINKTDGIYKATPDGSWDLIMGVMQNGKRVMLLTGQATKPAYVPYQAGTSSVVISFAAGTYLPHLKDKKLLNSDELLSIVDDRHFELAGHHLPFPTFENAEELVNTMVRLGILKNDAIVEGVLRGFPKATSKRAEQRHFKTVTGISRKKLHDIQRAQQAVKLLQEGVNPAAVAADTGYYDQPHLANSLKQIMDTTPTNVGDIHKL